MDELARLDGSAQAELVRKGEVKPIELVDAAIARIERLNPQLNAVIIPLFEKARQQAKGTLPEGPFRGVPMVLKDLTCTSAGDPYHAGMKVLKERKWIAPADSYLAAKLRAAGFVFVGRTNTPELGPIPTTEPDAYGPTHNPWDPARSPGGSSGGTAAAVAAGLVPLGHGNDGGGSIRVPASCCSLVGLKPSRGRTSLGPEFGDSWNGAVIEHVLTKSVRDTAAVLDAVHGYMPGDPYVAPPPSRPFAQEVGADPGKLRIGLLTRAPGMVHPVHEDCVAAAENAAKLLQSLGHTVQTASPHALDEVGEFQQHFGAVVTSWLRHDLDHWSTQVGRTLGPEDVETHTWVMAEMGRAVSAAEYIRAAIWLQAYTRRVASWWSEGFDLLLTPTIAEPPVLLGDMKATPQEPLRGFQRSTSFILFTGAFNVTGQPAISLPLHWNAAGLPIGVQLVAAYGREDVLLRLAAQIETAQPWANKRPPLHA